ncbi:hypothetical protein SAMN05421663_10232 [Terribacillus halophilus]|uniref:STAS domain-containing protein n=1 Tax=Terribacillus halophilus TaxID=361279 RepID=A0A1G6KIN2_9BACI|nr:hypothetical protein [Terribacillus halophilus]SDC30929.1 hypothetical protein SAMN05421663_10232 [Terribacillus halophilus]
MYKFEVDDKEKVLRITAEGFFKNKESTAFMETLYETFGSIQATEYDLIVDLIHLNVIKQDLVYLIADALKLYDELQFRNTVIVNPISILAKIQLFNIARSVHFSGTFVDSLEEWQAR